MLRRVRFCLMIEGQDGVSWDHWIGLATTCERLGFDAIFRSDHYFSSRGVAGRGATDAWTLLGALAARTSTIRLGTLVSPVTFRHPSLLAKSAATVDEISGGRVEIGLGAGWWEAEHTQFGFPFPPPAERMSMLEEQVEIVSRLLTDDVVTFDGHHYQLEGAEMLPKPVQRPRPPIIVGGRGRERGARIAVRWADEFNTDTGDPEVARRRFGRVRDEADAQGREQDSLTTSLMIWAYVGETDEEAREKMRSAAQRSGRSATADEITSMEREAIFGTPQRAADRLSEFAAAGVQRVMLNHELIDDMQMLELLAAQVFPLVEG